MKRERILSAAAALIGVAGLCTGVHAQDSIGTGFGTFGAVLGDALQTHDVATQKTAYVVNLSPITSSWGNVFGVAPIVKASQMSGGGPDTFFSGAISGNGISSTMLTGVAPVSSSYATWQGVGPGINPARNSAPQTTSAPAGGLNQLAAVFSEFGGTENSNIIGALINWAPNQSNRLFVTRVVGAQANDAANTPAFSTFGVGAIDANGNAHFRADSFGVTGATNRLTGGQWIYRVNMAARVATLNVLDVTAVPLYRLWADNSATTPFPSSPNLNNGNAADDYDGDPTGIHDEGATNAVWQPPVRADQNTAPGGTTVQGNFNHSVPNIIPSQLAGRPVYIGPNFNDEYVYENVVGALPATSSAHRTPWPSHRGAVAFTPKTFFSGTIGTAAVLARQTTGGAGDVTARSIVYWGTNTSGAIAGGQGSVNLPSSITDNLDVDPVVGGQFQLNRPVGPGQDYDGVDNGVLFPNFYFDHYHGQTAFRGPVSQMAIGTDRDGNALAAGTLYYGNAVVNTNPGNAIAVARFDPNNPSAAQWTLAAWNNYQGINGKPIYDGAGAQIGELASFEDGQANNLRNLSRNANSSGPSMSSPAFDSAGNIYFTSVVQIQRGSQLDDDLDPPAPIVGGLPNPERDLWEVGLIKGVYDAATFSYKLELLLRSGQVVSGADTGVQYMIDQIRIVGASSVDSSVFASGNVTAYPYNNVALASNIANSDPRHLGGLVVSVDLVYDNDGLDTTTELDDRNMNGFPDDYPLEVGGAGPFEDGSTAQGGTNQLFLGSTDQSYNVLLFVAPFQSAPPCNCVRGQGDANGDCQVNGADLSVLLSQFGTAVPVSTGADFNADGQVNGADLSVLLSNFGCQ